MAFAHKNPVLSDLVVSEVPTSVRATMSEAQISAVRTAADRRHAVDVRFTVPLIFTTLYFVLLIGKDTRSATKSIENERRACAGFHFSAIGATVLSVIALVIVGIVLYVLKSRAGINLFPDHAEDYVPFVR